MTFWCTKDGFVLMKEVEVLVTSDVFRIEGRTVPKSDVCLSVVGSPLVATPSSMNSLCRKQMTLKTLASPSKHNSLMSKPKYLSSVNVFKQRFLSRPSFWRPTHVLLLRALSTLGPVDPYTWTSPLLSTQQHDCPLSSPHHSTPCFFDWPKHYSLVPRTRTFCRCYQRIIGFHDYPSYTCSCLLCSSTGLFNPLGFGWPHSTLLRGEPPCPQLSSAPVSVSGW